MLNLRNIILEMIAKGAELKVTVDRLCQEIESLVPDLVCSVLIVDRAGVRVLRDPYSNKPYVMFYVTKRVGGGVQNFDAIKVLRFAVS